MTTRVLILWSGGVESTSLMKHLLSTTDSVIHAHFIRYENPEGRLAMESKAVATLTPLLKQIRDFEYSESVLSIADGKGITWDYAVHNLIGATAMLAQNCVHFLRAGALEDEWKHMQDSNGKIHLIKGNKIGDLHRERAGILKYILPPELDPDMVAPWLPYYEHSKAWHIRYLGDLFQYTWSCRTPKNNQRCDQCHACLEVEYAKHGNSFNPDVQNLLDSGTYE